MSARQFAGRVVWDVIAGLFSALVFYAEYMGLGSRLGSVLQGYGASAVAAGNALVLSAVLLGCLMACGARGIMLSGPRAASMVVFAGVLGHLTRSYGLDATAQTASFFAMIMAAAAVLLLALLPRVQGFVSDLPPWLLQGFTFATGLSLAVDGIARSVIGCMAVDETATWAIFIAALVLGLGWKSVMSALAEQRWLGWLNKFGPLGILAAAVLSWFAYSHTALAASTGSVCPRFGPQALLLQLVPERLSALHGGALHGWPITLWLEAMGCGLIVGAVLLLETVSSLKLIESDWDQSPALRPGLLRRLLATNLLSAIGGLGSSSYSQSRTHTLRSFGARSWLAVPVHGIVVVGIALLAGPLIQHMPQFTIGIVLVLVGVQMLGGAAVDLWRAGYRPGADRSAVLACMLFWGVLLLSVGLNGAIWGFAVGMAGLAAHRAWARRHTAAVP